MAYNNLSGTVILPEELLKIEGVSAGIVSGNLSTSDGADVINVPRVSNATNNSLITNVGGNANTLTCETNLTFDGTTLGLVGGLSGSGAVTVANSVSSSGDLAVTGNIHATAYYGNGSNLTGIAAGSVSGSVRIYSSTGIETSGYLKVSGSATFAGAVTHKRRTVSSNYSVSVNDYYIGVDTTGKHRKANIAGCHFSSRWTNSGGEGRRRGLGRTQYYNFRLSLGYNRRPKSSTFTITLCSDLALLQRHE